jgi:hypothetical protein
MICSIVRSSGFAIAVTSSSPTAAAAPTTSLGRGFLLGLVFSRLIVNGLGDLVQFFHDG